MQSEWKLARSRGTRTVLGRRNNHQDYRWTEGTADVDSDVQVNFAGFLNRSALMVPKVCYGNSWVGGQASLGKS